VKHLLSELRLLRTVLSWPQYGCLFWSREYHGDMFGHYESWESFQEEYRQNFERWGVRGPIVLIEGSAWRVRLIQWALRGERPKTTD